MPEVRLALEPVEEGPACHVRQPCIQSHGSRPKLLSQRQAQFAPRRDPGLEPGGMRQIQQSLGKTSVVEAVNVLVCGAGVW